MDKEIKAKIDEFLKDHGTRELSLDEMDKVSGGADGYNINGSYFSKDEITEFAFSIVDAFGYEVAAEMFCTTFGLSTAEIKKVHDGGSSDRTNMYTLVHRLFSVLDNDDGFH